MKLFNSASQQLESFSPRGDDVTLYVCGITPYDTTHLGHAFTYASFDLLIRYLEYRGIKVRYAQNVTDIDDDILRKARETGTDWRDLVNNWTSHFIRDNVALNLRPPDYFPRATETIEPIIATVSSLLECGAAYESSGNVYFSIEKWPEFGRLSGLDYAEMLPVANERGNFPDDPHKQNPLDFVLWQKQAEGEPAWPAPWSSGRPGWHIECSTLVTELLGLPVDIHGGGADLLFPHHECEKAQAECLGDGQLFARFWLHVAMVGHEGQKMSKSLGNLVMVRDLLDKGWHADDIRLYLAGFHYRRRWSHDDRLLEAASEQRSHLLRALAAQSGDGHALDGTAARLRFQHSMDSDLDSPAALAALLSLADQIMAASGTGQEVTTAQQTLRELAGILGLRLDRDGAARGVEKGWAIHSAQFQG